MKDCARGITHVVFAACWKCARLFVDTLVEINLKNLPSVCKMLLLLSHKIQNKLNLKFCLFFSVWFDNLLFWVDKYLDKNSNLISFIIAKSINNGTVWTASCYCLMVSHGQTDRQGRSKGQREISVTFYPKRLLYWFCSEFSHSMENPMENLHSASNTFNINLLIHLSKLMNK